MSATSKCPVSRPTAGALPWSPELFEHITDLLAEALYKDFQEHRRATVNSPQGTNRPALLTPAPKEHK
ncbi:hypothetical protein NITMOv2_3812 [Nitrospira moscoviensis]|uniref:Uncharacterized protein n=1 Tax=Nitrospira moscoviensis TaxID=42253 RepID=A0A0K2GHU3_NITMO|nr:hypothetical protein NITMOv2_3812 [Nitrospira moscoviensis]